MKAASPIVLGRRTVLRAGGGSVLLGAVTGCGLLSTDPAGREGDERPTEEDEPAAREASELARRVEAGDLPPLEDRLPKHPLVVHPIEGPGKYGGTWRSALLGKADTAYCYRTMGYDQLFTWSRDFTEAVPNIVESAEASRGGREYRIVLRAGMKWSDGNPFTAEDVEFTYNDVFLDERIYPVPSSDIVYGGEPVRVKIVDEQTLVFRYAAPNGLFALLHAAPSGRFLIPLPKHYVKRFHARYNPDVQKLVENEGQPDWPSLLLAKTDSWSNGDLPTLNAWRFTVPVGASTRVEAERNPYYWKTDPDGRQLPYIDKLVYEVIQNNQTILLNTSHGDFSYELYHINETRNKPVLARNRDKGGYRFIDVQDGHMQEMVIAFNLCHQNAKLREVFRDNDFRIGLSHAINRQEIIDTVFQRQGKPWQAAPRPESQYHLEELATQYTRFDPDTANEYLDRGYPEKDGSGFRLRPDGERIRFSVETLTGDKPQWVDTLNLVADYWKAVGVEMRVKAEGRSLYYERMRANKHDACVWNDAGAISYGALLDPRWFVPISDPSRYAIPWAEWYTSGGKSGEEPPEEVRRQLALYDKIKNTVDPDARDELFMDVLRIAQEQFYCIGTVLPEGGFGIASNGLHNVPDSMFYSWVYVNPGPIRPEQFYIDEGS